MPRSAGVLLHPTSLATPWGIGDLGPAAHAFVDWLASAGVSWWQVLPLEPPGPGMSPYSASSTFAGNPWLISPDLLAEDALVEDPTPPPTGDESRVDWSVVVPWKRRLLREAWQRGREQPAVQAGMEELRHREGDWIEDFALYTAIKDARDGRSWQDWPRGLARRSAKALGKARRELTEAVDEQIFLQLLFQRQWDRLHEHAASRGVGILGDLPIFVALDSAEVWARPELFRLDDERRPTVVAGVPPDYFSATGQRWGNPLYDWTRHTADGFSWWIRRISAAMQRVDALRIDHFRGFAASWEIPADAEVATDGRWTPGPGAALFEAVADELGGLPLIAEDLGDITDDVIELRRQLGLPGMAILQFGFDPDPRSTFIPYAHERDQVVYTGTHDNTTSRGWFWDEAGEGQRRLFLDYAASDGSEPHLDMVRLALASVADTAVVPFQDLLGLGSEGRMNVPGEPEGNWGWRMRTGDLEAVDAEGLRRLVEVYGRGCDGVPNLGR